MSKLAKRDTESRVTKKFTAVKVETWPEMM